MGLVHGLDWDHIAAITDIAGASTRPRRGFGLASMYAGGHAFVVLTMGLGAIALGLRLPDWIDGFMEQLVGISLIILSGYLISSIVRSGEEFRFRSRWMLLVDGVRAFYQWGTGNRAKRCTETVVGDSRLGTRAAFTIGMMHGVGVETPTQILLFVTAAGAGDAVLGVIVVLFFVFGLVVTNSLLAVLSVFGLARARRRRRVWMGAGAFTAVVSLVIGTMFLLRQSGSMPIFSMLG